MATMKGNRVLTSLYLDPEIAEELKSLSKSTGVPQAVYLREAVEMMLANYRHADAVLAGKASATSLPLVPFPPVLERMVRAARKPARAPRKPK